MARLVNNITFPRKGLNFNLKYGSTKNLVNFGSNSKVMILGYGSIGEGVLPLILRHFNMPYENISIVTASDRQKQAYEAGLKYGINVDIQNISENNYEKYLSSKLSNDDVLINASIDVSSIDVMEWCINNKVLYSDTVTEPWSGVDHFSNPNITTGDRSNYVFREGVLDLKRKYGSSSTSAISCHGATPGLVSHFMKKGLLNIAHDISYDYGNEPYHRWEWAKLANDLNIRCIQISDVDSMIPYFRKKEGEFVNTWSIDGFLTEAWGQCTELGYGTHEINMPFDGKQFDSGNQSSIYLEQPGILTKVRSWSPHKGPYIGYAITHNEVITISDYLTHFGDSADVIYRPTVHYAYRPSDGTMLSINEFIDNGCDDKECIKNQKLLLFDDIECGNQDLGVLIGGHSKNAYWFGCKTNVEDVGERIENNHAGSIQVTAPLMAGIVYMIKNKNLGVLECEDIDYKFILDIVEPYVGPITGEYTNWTPLQDRNKTNWNEDANLCHTDPWQWTNIRCLDMNQQFFMSNK